jgi:hypothetical protein
MSILKKQDICAGDQTEARNLETFVVTLSESQQRARVQGLPAGITASSQQQPAPLLERRNHSCARPQKLTGCRHAMHHASILQERMPANCMKQHRQLHSVRRLRRSNISTGHSHCMAGAGYTGKHKRPVLGVFAQSCIEGAQLAFTWCPGSV